MPETPPIKPSAQLAEVERYVSRRELAELMGVSINTVEFGGGGDAVGDVGA